MSDTNEDDQVAHVPYFPGGYWHRLVLTDDGYHMHRFGGNEPELCLGKFPPVDR